MDLTTFWTYFGTWAIGSFTAIDLIAATTNAFNGALLSRRPSHYRHYTVVGIVLLGIIAGIGGGVARDVLLNDIPAALTNPWYLIFCILFSLLAVRLSLRRSMKFQDGLFQFMTAFSLPWYAAIGVSKALDADLPVIAAVLIGVIGPTAGRFVIDLIAGVTPLHFVRGEWFVGTAVLTSVVFVICDAAGLSIWPATLIAFFVGFFFRLASLYRGWEEPEPWEPEEVKAGERQRETLREGLQEEFGKKA